MKIRPCIDLHQGKVKQIVGSTLNDNNRDALKENFVAPHPPSHYARMFRNDNLTGGHVIMLGPGNEEAASEALEAWPEGMQLGGGITLNNAAYWLKKGAAAVIVTSYIFYDGRIDEERLVRLSHAIGRERLVLDLSCRKRNGFYYIVTDRWQRFTEETLSPRTLKRLSNYCFEFLIHAADVEGKKAGIDEELVEFLAEYSPIPTTYAGGARNMQDVLRVKKLGKDKIDLTIGSALDIYGGNGITYKEIVQFNVTEGCD
ncbi:MAG: phosphoribosylformimino-5-aminoimidazole carboxamide ribotide isomerase [Dissulfuribacterales bacterium]